MNQNLFLATAALGLLLVTVPIRAQNERAEFSETGKTALEMVGQDNTAGAIGLLEGKSNDPETTDVDRSLLGTLYMEVDRAADALAILKPLAERQSADPAVLFNAGRAALALGQVEMGEVWLTRSLAMLPSSPAARALGLLRGAQGRHIRCLQLLRSWVAVSPEDAKARIAAANCALQLERADDAERLLEGLTSGPRVELLRAQARLQKSDTLGAIELLEPLVKSHPPEMAGDVIRLTAEAYINAGQASDAIEMLSSWEGSDPRAKLLLAEAQYRIGDVEGAASTLAPLAQAELARKQENRGETRTLVVRDYGRALAGLGSYAEALPYLELATRLRPDDSLGWRSLGEAQRGLGQLEESTKSIERFRDLSHAQTEKNRLAQNVGLNPVMKALAEANEALRSGESQRAVVILNQEIALSPGEYHLQLMLARTLLILERNDQALRVAEAAGERFPEIADVVYMRGVARMAANKPHEARNDLRRALALDPNHIAALNDLAVLFEMQGDKAEARRLLERVLELRPDDPMARTNLENLE